MLIDVSNVYGNFLHNKFVGYYKTYQIELLE